MEQILLIAILFILSFGIFILFNELKNKKDEIKSIKESTESRLEQIDNRIVKGLGFSTQSVENNFINQQKIIREITQELNEIRKTNSKVLDLTEKLENLENILKNPKQRGILGEYFLETILSNILPPDIYQMQYSFKNKETVDAVIFFNKQVIPIDAKFSLENFNDLSKEKDKEKQIKKLAKFQSDVKQRINETSKYIKPEENTTDFAFMFIPAEGVHSMLLNQKIGSLKNSQENIIEYAFKKKVIIVSPSSFYAYLETVLQGLKALKMEESVKEILKQLASFTKHIQNYEEHFNKLGNQLNTSIKTYNKASTELKKIDKDIYKLSSGDFKANLNPQEISEQAEN